MAKKIRTNKRRRVCRSVGCKHLLSIYNLETYCHVHRQIAAATLEPAVASASR